MPKQQTDASRKYRLSRVVAGVLIASFASAIWICLAIEIPDLLSQKPAPVPFSDAMFVAAVFFALILGVFVVFGLPAFFVVRHFKLNEIVLGFHTVILWE